MEIGERRAWQASGFLGFVIGPTLIGLTAWLFVMASTSQSSDLYPGLGMVATLLGIVQLSSLSVVQPGRTRSCSSSAATSARCASAAWCGPCR